MSATLHTFAAGRLAATRPNRTEAAKAIQTALLGYIGRASFTKVYNMVSATLFHRRADLTMDLFFYESDRLGCRIYDRSRFCYFAVSMSPTSPAEPLKPSRWVRAWEAALFDDEWEAMQLNLAGYVAPRLPRRPRMREDAGQGVIDIPSAADLASGRDRDAAARQIYRRLKHLYQAALQRPSGDSFVRVGDCYIWFVSDMEGVYFQIKSQGKIVMTGFLDPPRPGEYMDGAFSVMTWRPRGWERELFCSIDDANQQVGEVVTIKPSPDLRDGKEDGCF